MPTKSFNARHGITVGVNSVPVADANGNITANTILVGGASINSTSFPGTANNTTHFNGQLASYYTNASNLSTGTLSASLLPSLYIGTTTIQSTSGSQALSGITTLSTGNTTVTGFANVSSTLQVGGVATFNANVVVSTGLSANGTYGSNGQVLTSNGSTAFWSTPAAGGAIRVVTIADGTSITIDADVTDLATQLNTQAAGTLTLNAPTGTPSEGQKLILKIKSTNAQTFSWNGIFDGSADLSLPTTTSGGGLTDYMGFIYDTNTTKWHLLAKNFGF